MMEPAISLSCFLARIWWTNEFTVWRTVSGGLSKRERVRICESSMTSSSVSDGMGSKWRVVSSAISVKTTARLASRSVSVSRRVCE